MDRPRYWNNQALPPAVYGRSSALLRPWDSPTPWMIGGSHYVPNGLPPNANLLGFQTWLDQLRRDGRLDREMPRLRLRDMEELIALMVPWLEYLLREQHRLSQRDRSQSRPRQSRSDEGLERAIYSMQGILARLNDGIKRRQRNGSGRGDGNNRHGQGYGSHIDGYGHGSRNQWGGGHSPHGGFGQPTYPYSPPYMGDYDLQGGFRYPPQPPFSPFPPHPYARTYGDDYQKRGRSRNTRYGNQWNDDGSPGGYFSERGSRDHSPHNSLFDR